jgi:integrase
MAYIRKTDKAEIRGLKEVRGFPLILNHDYSVNWVCLNYMLSLCKYNSISSLKTYASHLVDFYTQLEVDGLAVSEVNDDWLTAYKSYLIMRNGDGMENTQNYASQVIRTVLVYCHWLTQQQYHELLCGEGKQFKIQIISGNKGGIKHPLIKNQNHDKKHIAAPWSEWIEIVKIYGPQREDLAHRYELMLDWGRLAGLRAHEICLLKIWQIPSRDSALKAIQQKRELKIKLSVMKGGQEGYVSVLPSLIIKTRDYIDLYRNDIVKKFNARARKKRENYKKTEYVFLSDKTGSHVTPKGLSNAVRKAFLTALSNGKLTDDERVWLHGLRHNFISHEFKLADKMNIKNPENFVRYSSRHKSVNSLNDYSTGRYDEDFN